MAALWRRLKPQKPKTIEDLFTDLHRLSKSLAVLPPPNREYLEAPGMKIITLPCHCIVNKVEQS